MKIDSLTTLKHTLFWTQYEQAFKNSKVLFVGVPNIKHTKLVYALKDTSWLSTSCVSSLFTFHCCLFLFFVTNVGVASRAVVMMITASPSTKEIKDPLACLAAEMLLDWVVGDLSCICFRRRTPQASWSVSRSHSNSTVLSKGLPVSHSLLIRFWQFHIMWPVLFNLPAAISSTVVMSSVCTKECLVWDLARVGSRRRGRDIIMAKERTIHKELKYL